MYDNAYNIKSVFVTVIHVFVINAPVSPAALLQTTKTGGKRFLSSVKAL